MAADLRPSAHRRAAIALATVSLKFLVLASLASPGVCQDQGPTLASPATANASTSPPPTMPPATVVPPDKTGATAMAATTSVHHTIAPANPTAGLLCVAHETGRYDLRRLVSVEYWTIDLPGACVDSYGDTTVNCQFSFAFCKQLPTTLVMATGIGASQISSGLVRERVLLGGLSQIEQKKDEAGDQLLVRYRHGDNVFCGGVERNLQVEMHLHCNEDIFWLTPHTGLPGSMPRLTVASFDKDTCTYTVVSQYDGACIPFTGLSAGTIVIIVFFCVVGLYLVGGLIFNKMAGAKGLELIPNYDMWMMFPSDVMGGFGFVWGIITCRGMRSKKEVYDEL